MTKKDRQGAMLLAGVSGLLIIAFIAKAIVQPVRAGIDNCVGTPTRNTVVVLDESDQVSDQTTDEIRSRALNYISDSTADNERVTLFTVSALSRGSLMPSISLCRPRSSGNRLTENSQLIEKRFNEKFVGPVVAALKAKISPSTESPLAQALIDISRTKYLRGADANALLVFSDMLENTPKFSLYRCEPAQVISQFRDSRIGAVERPTFKNAKVELNLIPREGVSRTTVVCRDKFWVWFFGDNSGANASVSVDYLPGGPNGAAVSSDTVAAK